MAFCPYNGDIVDEFGGLDDLRNKTIRFTGNPKERIEEDPCRILRACRFLAMLEGRFAPETLSGLRKNGHLVKKYVAPERMRLEIIKSLKCAKPSLFFDALHDIGILGNISPGFETCFDHDGGSYHGETIDKHIKLVGDFLPARKPLLRLTGYFHDHGKPAAAEYRDGRLSFINHAEVGAGMVEDEMKKLKFSLKEIAYVTALIRHHMRDINIGDQPKTVRRTLKVFQDAGVDWKDWFQLKLADTKGNLKKKNLDRKQVGQIVLNIHHVLRPSSKPAVLRINNLAINGEDVMKTLNLQPGPEVGRMLKKALDYVLDDPERNTYEKLVRFITDAEP
jgi:tRNA nucleotidyltransferase/poly(A) polymerase